MAGSNLRLAEEQRGIVPAAIQQIDQRVGNTRHFGLVLAKAVDYSSQIGQQARANNLEIVGTQGEITAIVLQNMSKPVRKLDIAVALPLCLPQSLDERLISD